MCNCEKERHPQSDCSPGVVENDESVLYLLIDPDLVRDGVLRSDAFSTKKLKNLDISVVRQKVATLAEVLEEVVTPWLSKSTAHKLMGCLNADVKALRDWQENNVKLFCVVDDTKDAFNSHAVLGFSDATREDKFWGRICTKESARQNLILLFGGENLEQKPPQALEDVLTA